MVHCILTAPAAEPHAASATKCGHVLTRHSFLLHAELARQKQVKADELELEAAQVGREKAKS